MRLPTYARLLVPIFMKLLSAILRSLSAVVCPVFSTISVIEDRKEGGALIWEREWESRELMEAAYERLFASPRVEALMEETRARVQKAGLEELHAGATKEYFLVLD